MPPTDSSAGHSAQAPRGPWRFVVLDWDNTLHDSAGVHLRALQTVLSGYGLAVDEAGYRDAYTTDYRALYRRLGLEERFIDEASDRWRELVAAQEPRLLPGAAPALDRLTAAGLGLGLLTTGRRATVLPQLERLELIGRFGAMVFGDGQPPRPDPAPLGLLLAHLEAPTDESALCSDTIDDVRMARAANVHAVGLATFAYNERALAAAGADETAPTLADWVGRAFP